MEDCDIIELYCKRSEQAIQETDRKYGSYCRCISRNIVENAEDAEECVNDAYLGAWRSIPPQMPDSLAAYLGKLTRYAALQKRRDTHRQKRGGGVVTMALEELEYCIPSYSSVERELEAKELTAAINIFLGTLSETERAVFLCRYWYLEPIQTISRQFGFSVGKIKTMLFRTRQKLKKYLYEGEEK